MLKVREVPYVIDRNGRVTGHLLRADATLQFGYESGMTVFMLRLCENV